MLGMKRNIRQLITDLMHTLWSPLCGPNRMTTTFPRSSSLALILRHSWPAHLCAQVQLHLLWHRQHSRSRTTSSVISSVAAAVAAAAVVGASVIGASVIGAGVI
jgi:hypothetical protein